SSLSQTLGINKSPESFDQPPATAGGSDLNVALASCRRGPRHNRLRSIDTACLPDLSAHPKRQAAPARPAKPQRLLSMTRRNGRCSSRNLTELVESSRVHPGSQAASTVFQPCPSHSNRQRPRKGARTFHVRPGRRRPPLSCARSSPTSREARPEVSHRSRKLRLLSDIHGVAGRCNPGRDRASIAQGSRQHPD